jgi:peptidyl-tRNA hydrolase
MKILALALLLLCAFSASADDLVATAKAAKEKKKKSTTKVITNADLKKSKGKIAENKPPAAIEKTSEKSLADQYESSYRDRLVLDEKRAAAQRKVEELEHQLTAIEQSYYAENDLDKRDTEIVKKFNDTKTKLDEARKELAALAPP